MKMVIIAVLGLLVIGGGGAGAYFYMQPSDDAEVAEAEVEKKEPEIDLSNVAFVAMDPFVMSVIGKDRTNQVISVAITLQVTNSGDAGQIENLRPKLTDAFLTEMYNIVERRRIKETDMLPIEFVSDRLQRISDRVLGEDVISDVLIQVLNQNPV